MEIYHQMISIVYIYELNYGNTYHIYHTNNSIINYNFTIFFLRKQIFNIYRVGISYSYQTGNFHFFQEIINETNKFSRNGGRDKSYYRTLM